METDFVLLYAEYFSTRRMGKTEIVCGETCSSFQCRFACGRIQSRPMEAANNWPRTRKRGRSSLHRLTAGLAGIRYHAEAICRYSQFPCQLRHYLAENMRGELLVLRLQRQKTLDMLLRDHQHMHRSLRLKTLERHHLVIFINEIRWNLIVRNLA